MPVGSGPFLVQPGARKSRSSAPTHEARAHRPHSARCWTLHQSAPQCHAGSIVLLTERTEKYGYERGDDSKIGGMMGDHSKDSGNVATSARQQ